MAGAYSIRLLTLGQLEDALRDIGHVLKVDSAIALAGGNEPC